MRRPMPRHTWVAVLALLFANEARADEVIVRAAHDTTLYENDASLSNGAGKYIFTGMNGGRSRRRALVQFDIGHSLPAGAKVMRAALTLRLSRAQARLTKVALHRVSAPWRESTSAATGEEGGGGPAAEADATWSHRSWQTETWQARGGDYAAQASAATDVGDIGTYTWSSDQLTADVQSFLDKPQSNYGWILVGDAATDAVSKRFDSRNHPAASGPSLSVTFEPPSARTGACCLPDGSCGVSVDGAAPCQAGATYMGAGTSCRADTCPEPKGACCLPTAAGSCEVRTQHACADGVWQGAQTSCAADLCPVVLTPFVDALPVPAVATPVDGKPGAKASYKISMVQRKQKLHRDLPETTVWGYDDGTSASYPGPTIVARSGEPIDVTWRNDLRDSSGDFLTVHPLPVDNCLHGAETSTPRTVVHLHGGHVPAEFDGQPELTLLPGMDTHYVYPNNQRAATLWYHDHAIGITRLNVIMGLAGFYLLRDAEEDALELPSGPYEIGLALQDRDFNPDGSFRYPARWQESFFGHTPVVNGKVAPYLEVDRGIYRFHLLNGSTSRVYTLSLSSGRSFVQIGTDGGLLDESVTLKQVTIAPGERADVLIDFSYAGTEEILRNTARSPYPNGGGGVELPELMKIVVKDRVGYRKPVPTNLVKPIAALKESDAAMTRELVLLRTQQDVCGNGMWTINGKDWHDITEEPHLGTREIWKFVNRSGVTHPMHLHMLFFQVLDRQKFKLEGDKLIAQGAPQPPNRSERGWKDTVQVGPFEAVRVIASFEDYEGTYPYHCHLLEHEDHGMMRQFAARAVCGDKAVAKGFEECDDGNLTDGDGCSSKCRNDNGAARTERSEREATAGETATMSGSLSTTPDAAVVADWRAPRSADSACSVQSSGARSHTRHWVWWLGLLALQIIHRARATRSRYG